MDVAWSPVGVDSRFYDYLKLSYVSDFLFIMSYDEQSQIYGECVAGANSGFYKTLSGSCRLILNSDFLICYYMYIRDYIVKNNLRLKRIEIIVYIFIFSPKVFISTMRWGLI